MENPVRQSDNIINSLKGTLILIIVPYKLGSSYKYRYRPQSILSLHNSYNCSFLRKKGSLLKLHNGVNVLSSSYFNVNVKASISGLRSLKTEKAYSGNRSIYSCTVFLYFYFLSIY